MMPAQNAAEFSKRQVMLARRTLGANRVVHCRGRSQRNLCLRVLMVA